MTATRQPRHDPLSRWAMTAPSRAIRTLGYLNEELLGAGEALAFQPAIGSLTQTHLTQAAPHRE
jgi:hypothetical protein